MAGYMTSVLTKKYVDYVCYFVRSPFELENKDEIVNEAFLGYKTIDGKKLKVLCVERKYTPTIEEGDILTLWCKPTAIKGF